MALQVGELVAYIRADTGQFDQAVDQSGSRLSRLGSAIGSGTRMLAGMFATAATAAVGVGAAVMRVGLDYNRLQQSSRAALRAMLGSAEAANAQMDKLDDFARTSPFAKQVFIQAQQQLLGFGVAAERVVPILDAAQNAVAAMGGSNQQISEIVGILAKIQSQGRITARELMQLGIHGLDAATLIGDAMGKTGEEIRGEITRGAIDAETALDALVSGIGEKYGDAADMVKEQFDGAVDRVRAATRDIGGILAEPFIDPQGGGRAVEWVNQVADTLRTLEEKAKPLVAILVQRMAPAFDAVTRGLDAAQAAVARWDLRNVNTQLDTLGRYAPAIAGVSAAMFALGSTSIPVLGRFLPALNPVVAGIAALVATSPELRAIGGEFMSALSPLIPVGRDLARSLGDTAMALLDRLTPALRDVLMAAAPVVVALGQTFGGALSALLPLLLPIADALGAVAGVLAEIPTPILTAVTAFVLLNSALGGTVGFAAGLPAMLASAKAAVVGLGTAMKAAFISNPIGLAIAGIAAVTALFADQQAKAQQRVDDYARSMDQATAAVTTNTRAVAYNNLEQAGYLEIARRAGIASRDLVDAALNPSSDAARRLTAELDAARAAMEESAEGGWTGPDLAERRDRLADLETLLGGVGLQSEALAGAQERLRDEIAAGVHPTEDAAGAVRGHSDALRENITLQDEAAGRALSLREAQLRAESSQDRVREAVTRYNETLADSSASEVDREQAARAVEEAMIAQVRSYGAVTDAMARNNESALDLWNTVKRQREAFIDNQIAMGKTRAEAEALADTYGLIPDEVVTNLRMNTSPAEGTIERFVSRWNNKSIAINVHTRGGLTPYVSYGEADGGIVQAANGLIRQPMIAKGGANILWAEPETGWEAYISGKPGMRARNLGILAEAADRLGYMVMPKATGYADGHVTRGAQSPTFPTDGWSISGRLELGVDGVARLVEGRLRQSQDSRSAALRAGVR